MPVVSALGRQRQVINKFDSKKTKRKFCMIKRQKKKLKDNDR
jgi:hypothetical protein